MSGFSGHFCSQDTDVRLVGHKSPTGATGSHPSYVGSVITDLSVKAYRDRIPRLGLVLDRFDLIASWIPGFRKPLSNIAGGNEDQAAGFVLAKAELIDGRGP